LNVLSIVFSPNNTLTPAAQKGYEPMPGLEKSREQLVQEVAELRQRLTHAEAKRERAEAALALSEERFNAFLDNSPCVAFLKAPDGRYLYGNAGWDRLLPTKRNHFLGRTDQEFFPGPITQKLRQNDAKVLATGQTLETIEEVPDAQGVLRSWLVMKFPVPDASGDTLLGGVAIDITERRRVETELRQAETELQQQNAILHSILDSMAEGVIVSDGNGRFLHINRAAEEIAGDHRVQSSPEEWPEQYGLFFADGVTLLSADQVPLIRAIRGEVVEAMDLYLNNKTVSTGRWLNVTARPLRDKAGSHYGGVVVFRDVTERRVSEEKLKEYTQQLQALSRRLLRIQEEERRHLARDLHDEVGQALTGLKLMFEKNALDPPGQTKDVFHHAVRLAQDLMVRVRALSMHLRPTLLDDLGLVPALQWHVEQYTMQTGVHVTMELVGINTGDRLPSDVETAAYRIVQEALTNVARHTEVNDVAVQVRRENDELLVRIEDRGAGFDAKDIWESSGISGMRERATLLGGTLVVQSQPCSGTQIFAQLPVGSQC
jgi:PAS domain S-box-containing protein